MARTLSSNRSEQTDHADVMGSTNGPLRPKLASVPADTASSPVCKVQRVYSEVPDHFADTTCSRQKALSLQTAELGGQFCGLFSIQMWR